MKNAISANGIRGLFNSISPAITSNDVSLIKEYNRLVGVEGVSSQSAWYRTMLSSSRSAQALFDNENNLIRTNNGLILSEEALTRATNTMTIGAKAGKVALQALAMAGNMLIGWAIIKGIELAATALDNWIHRVEKAEEATREAIDTFKSISSEVESLDSKIKELNDQINKLDPITDAEDIENLKLETEELNTQLSILKEKQRIAESDADKAAQESLKMTQASRYQLEERESAYGGVEVGAAYVTKDEELLNAIEAYEKYKLKVEEANKALAEMAETGKYSQKEWREQEQIVSSYSNKMEEARSYANELRLEIDEQAQGLNGNTEASQKLLDTIGNATSQYDEWLNAINGTTDALNEQADVAQGVAIETAISFSIGDHEEAIDNIQSAISTLRSALDSFNQGTLDESAVIDLMQQFPALIPYIDLAADGFGNLSEGLSTLIAQQPESLIQSLQTLKSSLNTDEERAQVDALINSLQALSSYGDTGMEAYATSIGSTWSDTANVIQTVTDQFENLAKVQEAVADGLTMSTTAAAELAQMYPEILTNAVYAGNGQIQLNEEVVKSILAGDQSIIDAQITKLEADKAELEARKETAIAELQIANQVGTAKGQISLETARNKIDLLNQELEAEISKNNQVGQSYAQTAEGMALNAQQLVDYVANVADNMATNMNSASASMADGMAVNSEASQHSLGGIMMKAADAALAVANIATGKTVGNPNAIYSGKGGTNKGGINKVTSPGKFTANVSDFVKGDLSLKDFQSQLEVDIKGYEQAISNIDSQIEVLKNLQATFNETANSANGGIGGHNYADKIKDLEKEKDKINSALDDAKGKGSKSAKETKDEYEELFDFFERRVKVLDNALALLKTNLNNVVGSEAKNKLIDAELGVTEEKFKNYSDALNMYTQKANEALSKLPSDVASKIKDGAVDLTTFVGEGNKDVVEAIKDYEQWADKVADCKQELAELRTAIRQLELEKFNNIMEEFSNQFDLREDGKNLVSKQIDLLKEAGNLIGESFFTTQIDQSKKQLALLEEEKAKLVEQMSSAVSSGRVD